MNVKYEAYGDVCGSCGHQHRTIRGAIACAEGHQRGISAAYPSTYPTRAYSDRSVRRIDGEDMTPSENAEEERYYTEHMYD